MERLMTVLAGTFALLAVVLAAVGLYGTVSHLTTARTREIGVRMALGATPGAIRRLVLAETCRRSSQGRLRALRSAWEPPSGCGRSAVPSPSPSSGPPLNCSSVSASLPGGLPLSFGVKVIVMVGAPLLFAIAGLRLRSRDVRFLHDR
jgi:hypothetical protein